MKRSAMTILCITTIALFPPAFAGTAPMAKRRPSADEPFRTFRVLDDRLTRLEAQQRSLEAVLEGNQSNTGHNVGDKRSWAKPAHAMETTNMSIQRLLIRAERLYRIRHRRFGVRLFRILRCCEPKKTQDLREGEQAACRWVCAQKPLSCTGFVGPRIR